MIEDAETTTEAPPQPALVGEIVTPEQSLSTKELVALDPAAREALERRDAGSYVFDPSAFALAQQVAKSIAASTLLPDHLKSPRASEQIANCLFLVADAMRWRISPHALMAGCYRRPGGGGLAYEGKIIAGVLNKFLNIRLNYRFSGEGPNRACAAFATIPGELEERTTTPVIYHRAVTKGKDGQPKPAWANDPDQKLSYNAAMKWGRMHAPELVTGVITADEADEMAEERRAMLPATPAPGATPKTLQDFVNNTPEPRQEAAGPTPPVSPEPAAPPADPAPPGAIPASPPASKRAIDELGRLAKDNEVSGAELDQICREVTGGKRLLQHLVDADLKGVVAEILRTGKDGKH